MEKWMESLGNTPIGMLVSYRPLAYPGSRGGKVKQNFYDKKPVRFFLRLNKDITKPGPRRDDDDGR